MRQPDCPEEDKIFRAISLDTRRGRPRLVFDGNRANLRAAIGNPRVRRKLGKALMTNFNWPDADEVHLTNDFVPYIILDDQNSSLEFLSSLFFAFLFIKLVR